MDTRKELNMGTETRTGSGYVLQTGTRPVSETKTETGQWC